ncbi:MAG: hypothetical protein Q8J97_14210, partial [Flavobacteriaceae bacterium]|nr:hypothetical protein [Flavobacteriaceae bacterium]
MRHAAYNLQCSGTTPVPNIEISDGSIWDASVRPSSLNHRGAANMMLNSALDNRNISVVNSVLMAECTNYRTTNIELHEVALKLSTVRIQNSNLSAATSEYEPVSNVMTTGSSLTMTAVNFIIHDSSLHITATAASNGRNVWIAGAATFDNITVDIRRSYIVAVGPRVDCIFVGAETGALSHFFSFAVVDSVLDAIYNLYFADTNNIIIAASLDRASVVIADTSMSVTSGMYSSMRNLYLTSEFNQNSAYAWRNVDVSVLR